MKFRKKPVVIEAMQLSWATWQEICEFVPKPYFNIGVYLDDDLKPVEGQRVTERMGLLINTLESTELTGSLLAVEGDWIIKGVKGEFYPIKDEIFRETYEAVEEASA